MLPIDFHVLERFIGNGQPIMSLFQVRDVLLIRAPNIMTPINHLIAFLLFIDLLHLSY